ncbi:MAG: molybdopterin molybdotransferase MoeA [Spirochaetales bacterium]|nr:molybdopterin molybdotransferase MoeA [Spirochaetales bacterium]
MELLKVITVDDAKRMMTDNFKDYILGIETVPLRLAAGRFLAEDIKASVPVPAFRRSTKDGYAVRSRDVSGAAETLPAFLKLTGEIQMGQAADLPVGDGEAVYVPTGAMIPDGADAIVMIEYTEVLTEDEIAVYRPSFVKENIINRGEDIQAGALVLSAGRKLKAADLGVLTSVGRLEVKVFRKPVVSVISTGDEIVAPDQEPAMGQIRDINTYTLAASAEAAGFVIGGIHVCGDDRAKLGRILKDCHEESDIVLLSGGSSVGTKDYSLEVISGLGAPGILCHGLAFKPGKPTIIANSGGKPVIGLPGHPVSALVVFGIIGDYLLNLMNCAPQRIEGRVEAVLTENVSGAPGREAWQMVRLVETPSGFEARPVHGESGLITLLAEASGTVRIPRNTEGIPAGTAVQVFLIER